jgi:hypothetical protein
MKSPPIATKTEIDAKILYRKIDAAVTLCKAVIKYGALVLCVRYLFLIAGALAGKTTLASLVLSVLANAKVSDCICLLFGGGGAVYGVAQRQLRRRAIKRLTGRPKELEVAIDPNRSSSELTARGTTRPEDES